MIIYNDWINVDKIKQYHYKEFFKYSENRKLFKNWQNLLRDISDIYSIINNIIEGTTIFNYEYVKLIKHYLFIYTLDKLLRVENKSECKGSIINVDEPKAFSFYSFIDTNISSSDTTNKTEEYTYESIINDSIDMQDNINVQDNNDVVNDNIGNNKQETITTGGGSKKLIDSIEKQKVKGCKVAQELVINLIEYIYGVQSIYNKMNNDNIRRIKNETSQKQTRMNLDTVKALKKEGFNTDYNIIMQRMKMGSFSYSELYERVKEQMGDDFVDEYVNEYNDTKGEQHDVGDEDYDPIDAEEIGALDIVEAEDMEDDHVDYGFMVVN